MPVIPASEKHLMDVMFLLQQCTQDMNRKGMFHWNDSYPGAGIIREDIRKGDLYIFEEYGIVKGMMVLNSTQSEEYKDIQWTDVRRQVGVVHRLAVHPVFQGKGTGKKLLEFALEHMKSSGYGAIRLDVIGTNREANALYRRLGFRETGSFHFPFQKDYFVAYELVL